MPVSRQDNGDPVRRVDLVSPSSYGWFAACLIYSLDNPKPECSPLPMRITSLTIKVFKADIRPSAAFFVASAFIASIAEATPRANVQGDVHIVAITGDILPGGQPFLTAGVPIMSESGGVVIPFRGTVPASSFGGIQRWASGVTRTLIDTDDPVPLANSGEVFRELPNSSLAGGLGSGSLAFSARMIVPFSKTWLFRRAADGVVDSLITDNVPAPGGDGILFVRSYVAPSINSSGVIAAPVGLSGTSGGSTDNEAIVRFDPGSASPIEIVRKNNPTPDGNGTLSGPILQSSKAFASPPINRTGQVAFLADVDGTNFADNGIFVGSGFGLTRIARAFEPVPGAAGEQFDGFGLSTPINDQGQVAFLADFGSGSNSLDGVFVGNGSTTSSIALGGQAAPAAGGGHSGTYYYMRDVLSQNAAGQVVFHAKVADIGGVDDGLFLWSRGAGTTAVVRYGQALPGGGMFDTLTEFCLNDSGSVLFQARLQGSSTNGVWSWSPGVGLREVIREGAALGGSTLTEIEFNGAMAFPTGRRDGLGFNAMGWAAFRITLADGRRGIATTAPDSFGESFCDATVNSSGRVARVIAFGSRSVADNNLTLFARDLPANQLALFVMGSTPNRIPLGPGFLCVGGVFHRLPAIGVSGGTGRFSHSLDLTASPLMGAVTPGSTWSFQCWFRDTGPVGNNFNLTDGFSVSFQ